MIAVTQSCLSPKFVPLGIVMVDSDWLDTPVARLGSLIKKLKAQAPAGTTHLFNVKFEPREYHGHHYLFGYADAYAAPVPESISESTEKNVVDMPKDFDCPACHYFG
jgi:hypothetical protein